MERVKHTPGPWNVLEPVGTWISTTGDPYGHGRMHVADVRGWGHLTGSGSCALAEDAAIAIQAANANLIAAAPDLLKMVHLLGGNLLCVKRTGNTEDFMQHIAEIVAEANVVLMKAEGR